MTPEPPLAIRLLGPPDVRRAGAEVAAPRGKLAALLARLVVDAAPASRAELCELLWPGAPPERGRLSLRVALSQLRSIAPGRVEATRDAVWFVPAAGDEIDVAALERGAAVDADEAALGQASAAARGPLLEGLDGVDTAAFDRWLDHHRLRLADAARRVALRLADARAARGRAAEALEHLQRAVAIDPLDEAARCARALALARGGDVASALADLAALRAELRDGLGVDPLPATLAVRERLAAAAARRRPARCPTPTTAFVGREAEVGAVLDGLAGAGRVVTVVGAGGIGKTRLAIEVARRLAARFLDGVAWVPLAGLAADDPVAAAVAASLGLAVVGGEEPAGHVLASLRERELLLVLDNFETVADQAAACEPWVATAPGLRILATSRQPLGVAGETVVRIDGLAYPAAAAPFAPERYDAVALFVAAARRRQHDFDLAPDWDAVGAICRQVEGFPLAIELAAAWLDDADCATIAARLADDRAETPAAAGLPERHASLAAVFAHTWQRLAGAERLAFARLCVFRGGFDDDAAAALGVDAAALVALADRSLVRASGDGRFAIHEVLRRFGVQRLDASAALAERVRDGHAAHYVGRFGALVAAHGADARAVAMMADGDGDNLLAAWRHAVDHRRLGLVGAVATDLVAHYYAQGPNSAGLSLCDAVVRWWGDRDGAEAQRPALGALAARLAAERGFFALRRGDAAAADSAAGTALAIAADLGDERLPSADAARSAALRLRGIVRRNAGELDGADGDLAAAEASARTAGDARLAAEAAYHRAGIAVYRGDVTGCLDATRAALASVDGRGFLRLECAIYYTLSVLYDRAGDIAAGLDAAQRCLERAIDAAYRLGEMNAAATIGALLTRGGQLPRAIEHLERSLLLADELGHYATERLARLQLAEAFIAGGRLGDALYHVERVAADARSAAQPRLDAQARLRLAMVQRLSHDLATAAGNAAAAWATFEGLGDAASAAMARAEVGRCARLRGELDAAARDLDAAAEALAAHGARTQWLSARLDVVRLRIAGDAGGAAGADAALDDIAAAAARAGVAAIGPAVDVVRGRVWVATDAARARAAFARALDRYVADGLPHLAVEAAAGLARGHVAAAHTAAARASAAAHAADARALADAHFDDLARYRLAGVESPAALLDDVTTVLAGVDHPSAARWTDWIDRWWRDHPDHHPRPPDARGGPPRPAAERYPPRPPKPRRTAGPTR